MANESRSMWPCYSEVSMFVAADPVGIYQSEQIQLPTATRNSVPCLESVLPAVVQDATRSLGLYTTALQDVGSFNVMELKPLLHV